MTAARELTDAERVERAYQARVALLEDEVQHLAAECDRLQQEVDRAHSHRIEAERIRTLDEHRGAIPRYHRQVW